MTCLCNSRWQMMCFVKTSHLCQILFQEFVEPDDGRHQYPIHHSVSGCLTDCVASVVRCCVSSFVIYGWRECLTNLIIYNHCKITLLCMIYVSFFSVFDFHSHAFSTNFTKGIKSFQWMESVACTCISTWSVLHWRLTYH